MATTRSTESSGNRRQLMLAAANWGKALLACPPSSCVATQLVRIIAFSGGDAAPIRRMASRSPSATRIISAASAFVQSKLRINQISMVLQQPSNAVMGTGALLVRCERDDKVTVRRVALSLQSQERCDPNGGLRLVVCRTATVEVTVLFNENER